MCGHKSMPSEDYRKLCEDCVNSMCAECGCYGSGAESCEDCKRQICDDCVEIVGVEDGLLCTNCYDVYDFKTEPLGVAEKNLGKVVN